MAMSPLRILLFSHMMSFFSYLFLSPVSNYSSASHQLPQDKGGELIKFNLAAAVKWEGSFSKLFTFGKRSLKAGKQKG